MLFAECKRLRQFVVGSLWKTTTRPNIETPIGRQGGGDGGEAKSRADADNVYSDQAKKAEALTQDHQDKLSSHNASPLVGKGEHTLLHAPSPRPQPQAQTISMT